MIVITNIDYVEAEDSEDMRHNLYKPFKTMSTDDTKSVPTHVGYQTIQGDRFVTPDGREICVGSTILADEVIGFRIGIVKENSQLRSRLLSGRVAINNLEHKLKKISSLSLVKRIKAVFCKYEKYM